MLLGKHIFPRFLIGWFFLSLLCGFQQYLLYSLDGIQCGFWESLFSQVPNFMLWSVYGLLILRLDRRFPLLQTRWYQLVLIHGLTGICIALVHILVLGTLRWLWWFCCTSETWQHSMAAYSRAWFFFELVLYAVILLLINVVHWYRQFQEKRNQALLLETQLTQAELNILKMQLNPHFLFNALNTVSMLIRLDDSSKATQTLASLGQLLREYLKTSITQEVSLSQELTNLRRYLDIESIRFQHRFQYVIEVADSLETSLVPDLILQPLAENAIRHGFSQRTMDCWLAIRIQREADTVCIRIEDNGIGFNVSTIRKGIGLTNTEQRLQKIYGHAASLTIESQPEKGTQLQLLLPITRVNNHEQPQTSTRMYY